MLIRQKGMPTPYLPVPFPILSTFLPPWVKWGGWWGPQTWRISVLAVLAPWVSHVANVWSKQSHQNSDNTHLFGYFLVPNVSPIHLHHWVIYIYIYFFYSAWSNQLYQESSRACPTVYWHFCWHFGQSILVSAGVCRCLQFQGTPCKYSKLFLTFLTFPPGKLFYKSTSPLKWGYANLGPQVLCIFSHSVHWSFGKL